MNAREKVDGLDWPALVATRRAPRWRRPNKNGVPLAEAEQEWRPAGGGRTRINDWNALHRDLHGDLVFPLQVVIGLDKPGVDHTGGEFLLVEQRPRAQSRGTATLLPQGHSLIFTTRDRPVRSARGWSASPVRHGVSAVRSGVRHTLGLVFHDAA